MKCMDYVKWVMTGEAGIFFRLTRASKACYRISFLSPAGKTGLLSALPAKPRTLGELLDVMRLAPEKAPCLAALLHLGRTLGEIGLSAGRYRLKGKLARALSREKFDAYLRWPRRRAASCAVHRLGPGGGGRHGSRCWNKATTTRMVIARSSLIAEPCSRAPWTGSSPGRGRSPCWRSAAVPACI
jgi:hypothetical protein